MGPWPPAREAVLRHVAGERVDLSLGDAVALDAVDIRQSIGSLYLGHLIATNTKKLPAITKRIPSILICIENLVPFDGCGTACLDSQPATMPVRKIANSPLPAESVPARTSTHRCSPMIANMRLSRSIRPLSFR